jgi:uncharacterized coiled-coil DUF342 family protein
VRQRLKELYEQREAIGARITELHRRFDDLRDDAIRPLSDQCEKLDNEMTALVVEANATWIEGRMADDGLPDLEPA